MVIPGWAVVREISPEVQTGLISGKYQLYGGVIRWASGTENAGQIVRHLVPSSGLIPGHEFMPNMAIQLEQIIRMATLTASLSGLNLAVSCVGFIVINSKLNEVDKRLKEIQQDVKDIKHFLDSSERARLFSALNELLKVNEKMPVEHSHTILHNSRSKLGEVNMRYRELLSQSNTMETAIANEEYFSLTALALVRCTAELGMFDIAFKEIDEMNFFWQSQARRIVRDILIGEYPERFLATDFVDDVSAGELTKWLDFAFEEQKGLIWIDHLRRKIKEPWYEKDWFTASDETKSNSGKNFDFFGNISSGFSSMSERIKDNLESGSGLNKNIGIGLKKEQTILIPAIKKLIARSEVFEGYVSQYELLITHQMKPSEFEKELAELPESSAVGGHFIFEPVFEWNCP